MASASVARAIADTRSAIVALREGAAAILAVASRWFLMIRTRLAASTLVRTSGLSMDLSTAGLLLSMLWVAYTLLQLPGSILGDRVGERITLTSSAAMSVAAVATSMLAWPLADHIRVFVLLYAAAAIYPTRRFTVVSDVFPAGQPRPSGSARRWATSGRSSCGRR